MRIVNDLVRDRIQDALQDAMRAKDKVRTGTLRLMKATIKDRDIAARTDGREKIADGDVLEVLDKMVRQRRESSKIYEEAGRLELAGQETAEISIISEFMPEQMTADEVHLAVTAAVKDSHAGGLRDMGQVMGILKERHANTMDFTDAARIAKELLGKAAAKKNGRPDDAQA